MLREGATMTSLSRELDVDPSAMTRSLSRLAAKGLVRCERSRQDRRVVHVALTAEGRSLAERVPAVLSAVLDAHLHGFSETERLQLHQFLTRMLANARAGREAASCATTTHT